MNSAALPNYIIEQQDFRLKTELQIAVRALVEHTFRSGDLEMVFQGLNRSVEAIRIHQKIQKSRSEEYHSELPVYHERETEDFLIKITGRIDGVYKNTDPIIIDEIKTTTRDLDSLKESENQVAWGQVKTYAYLYAIEHGLDEIGTQITYYQMNTGKIQELRRIFLAKDLETFFQDLIAQYLECANMLARWCRIRDESTQKLDFPFAAYRPGQRKMAVDVYKTIKNEGQLIVQAATGIGKTMAVIFPAIKAMGEGLTSKIFYLTARTTGRSVAEKALDELRRNGLKVKSLTLTAKDKICFSPQSACSGDECTFAKGFYDRLNGALKDILSEDAITRQAVEEVAKNHRVCPFEFSLDLSLWVDCIICDYNYVFDPRVFLRRFFLERNTGYTLLVDEAHNLVDRSREMFSSEIRKQPFLDMRRSLKNHLPSVYRSMGKIIPGWLKPEKDVENPGISSQK